MNNTVTVVGAGLAGLRAAVLLVTAGQDAVVLEGSDAVGGRVATDVVDGFRLDRGFQLLNPFYPAARRALDMGRLDLHRFGRGAAVRTEDGLAVLADPTRHPKHASGLMRGPLTGADLGAVARWLRASGERDSTLTTSLDAAGFSPAKHIELLAEHAPNLRLDVVLADASFAGDDPHLDRWARSLGAELVVADLAARDGSPRHDTLRLASAYAEIMGV